MRAEASLFERERLLMLGAPLISTIGTLIDISAWPIRICRAQGSCRVGDTERADSFEPGVTVRRVPSVELIDSSITLIGPGGTNCSPSRLSNRRRWK